MGIPTFLRSSMLAVSSIVVNNVAGSFSDSALAAVTVANKSAHLVGSGIIGLSQGFQPVAGYNWGAKNYNRVRKAFWACTVMGVSASIVLGAILAVFARRLVGVFTSSDDLEILQIGSYMIITQCITMGFHTWGVISNGLFQALGRSVGAAILGLSRQLICLLPCVLILSKLFGVYGLASAQAAADILTFIVALLMTVALFRRIKRIEYENNMLKIKNQPENTQSKIEHHGVISI
jgi:Na+-driven multidrug efflux pump